MNAKEAVYRIAFKLANNFDRKIVVGLLEKQTPAHRCRDFIESRDATNEFFAVVSQLLEHGNYIHRINDKHLAFLTREEFEKMIEWRRTNET